jgi:prepilin-type processing-associated H-X9-DG protein
LLVVIAIMGILSALLLPALNATREKTKQTQCMSNLRSIGLACKQYEGDWNSYPDAGAPPSAASFRLLSNYIDSATIFICPCDPLNPTPAHSVGEMSIIQATFGCTKNNSYDYVTHAFGKDISPYLENTYITNTVVASDRNGFYGGTFYPDHWNPKGNHRGKGMNMLFLDGRVQWFGKPPNAYPGEFYWFVDLP